MFGISFVLGIVGTTSMLRTMLPSTRPRIWSGVWSWISDWRI